VCPDKTLLPHISVPEGIGVAQRQTFRPCSIISCKAGEPLRSNRGHFVQQFFASRAAALAFLIGILSAPPVHAQATAPRPEFEVATVKQYVGDGQRSFIGSQSPGTLSAENVPLKLLIQQAYSVRPFQVQGLPGWIDSERYDLHGKARVDADPKALSRESMNKSFAEMLVMLQVLLEDRFNLKLHRETKEFPIYALSVAKGGPKLPKADCIMYDPENPPAPVAAGGKRPTFCGNINFGRSGSNRTLDAAGVTMKSLIERALPNIVDRMVIDTTGLTDTFNVHLEWAPDVPMPGLQGAGGASEPGRSALSTDNQGPSIFSAIQEQLGLKLESTKGPVEVLVIDHVEKPSAN
jgi:uncharacterized protein (TIGR03435 family)